MKYFVALIFAFMVSVSGAQSLLMPYKGGVKSMEQWMNTKLVYPKPALAEQVEATVSVFSKVQPNGKITDIKIPGKNGWGFNEEATQLLLSLSHNWNSDARKQDNIHNIVFQFRCTELKGSVTIKQYSNSLVNKYKEL